MNTTESNRICVSCDAPFLPTKTDLCARCEQRQSDRLCGAKLSAWIAAALIFSALAAFSRCHGAQDFRTKPTEGKARQHEVIHTNQTNNLGAPANHSAGALSVVDDALLNRVAWVESRNNPRAVGKLDERGAYQLRPIAIREVNRVFGTKYHIRDARKMVESREIARLYLLICESRCRVKTPSAVYARYQGKR